MKTNVIKRITGAVLAAVLGTAALTGCGAGNSSTASTSTSKDESGATESKAQSVFACEQSFAVDACKPTEFLANVS